MAKYKVLKRFRDIYTDEVYKKDTEIEMNVERANEANENLKKKGVFLERLDVPEKEVPKGEEVTKEVKAKGKK